MRATAEVRQAIDEIVRRLVEHYQPEKIILYGSYAYGQPDEDSDIDLLIIKRTAEPLLDRLAEVRRLARGAHPFIPFQPLVLTPEELQERLRIGDQFFAQILLRGAVLYEQ